MNTNEIDQESNSISLAFAPLQKRQIKNQYFGKKQDKNAEERIKQLDHRLIVNVEIITPLQLPSYLFMKELKTYRFQRKPKVTEIFSDTAASEEREIQQMFSTFKDIFSEWRTKISNKFYIVFNNRDLFYFFHKVQEEDVKLNTKKGGSFLVLNCRKTNYEKILQDYEIKYQRITGSGYESHNLLLRNNNVQLFWRYLTNSFMQKATQVELVSNFYYMNSFEVLPVQIYNGKQQRPQYEYIAHKKINILEEIENEMYSVRMQGYWFKQNLQNVHKKVEQLCKGKPFQLNFHCHYGSPDSQEIKQFYDKL